MQSRYTRLTAVFAVAMCTAAPASAADPLPGLAGLWQYVEMVPSAGGATAERPTRHLRPLTSNERHAVATAPAAERAVLDAVVGSNTYGAPAVATKRPRVMRPARHSPTIRSTAPARVAPADRTDWLGIALLVLIPLSFGAALGTRLLGGRRSRARYRVPVGGEKGTRHR